MGKQETVSKYIDAFLKGRTKESADKFRAKDVNKQYSSIMQWRRKLRKQQETPQNVHDITEGLKKIRTLISNAPQLCEDDIQLIRHELAAIENELSETIKIQRLRKIEELESQQEAIRRELEELRR